MASQRMTEQTEAGVAPPLESRIFTLSGLAQVTNSLFLSNETAANNHHLLNVHRITCVINVCLENDIEHHNSALEYLHYPIADMPNSNLLKHFEAIYDKIRDVEVRGGRTLVHCNAGISRSPSICLAYLMKSNGMTLIAAHSLLRTRRPIIHPNSGFWEQLIRYELDLFGNNSIQMINSPMGLIPNIYEKAARNMFPL
uniref:Protein-tyrosine-phosphatase n=1 Tax=Leptobrachium leishanense TaxID=445787 RepID=A0A8C5PZN7_9ANUR